jgi:hypothetical protein
MADLTNAEPMTPTPQFGAMPDPIDAISKTIAQRLDHLCRLAKDKTLRLNSAERAGVDLASAVQRFLTDPAAVGTDALYAAYGRYMSVHAGNFSEGLR